MAVFSQMLTVTSSHMYKGKQTSKRR